MEVQSIDLSKYLNEDPFNVSKEQEENEEKICSIVKDDMVNISLTNIRKQSARRAREVIKKIEDLEEDMKKLNKKINDK